MPTLTTSQMAEFSERTDAMRQRLFLENGRAGKLKVENFQAPTGIGSFDLTYRPDDHRVEIVIRIFYEWEDKVEEGRIKWDHASKADFRLKAKALIETFWSERYMITCRRPGWLQFYGEVKVTIVEVSERQRAHFVLQMRRVTPDKNTGGGVNWGMSPPVCDVNQFSVEPKVQFLAECFNLIQKQMVDAVASHGVDYIPFAKDSAELPVDLRLKLMRFAQYLGRVRRPDTAGIKLYIYGSTGSQDSFFQTGLGKKRAAAVRDFLAAKIAQPDDFLIATDSSSKKWLEKAVGKIIQGQTGSTRTTTKCQGVCLVIHTPDGVVHETQTDYLVLAHEAGHFLGLPDEYMGRHHPRLTAQMDLTSIVPKTVSLTTTSQANERLAGMQLGMAEMLEDTNLPSPLYLGQGDSANQDELRAYQKADDEWFAKRKEIRARHGGKSGSDEEKRLQKPVLPESQRIVSRSIMYSGAEVLPAHYLPIWAALGKATAGYLDPREWVIVPSTTAHSGSLQYFSR